MTEEKAHAFKLIVFNIEKPVNVGILLRTAYAMGCDEVLIVGKRRFKVTGASHTHRVQKWRHFYRMEEAAAYCRDEGYRMVGVEIGGQWLHETRFNENVALVLGNEGRGLSDAQPFCDTLVTIPQWGGVPSMNVAMAGAIVMYEFQKQQNLPCLQTSGQKFYDDHYPMGDVFELD